MTVQSVQSQKADTTLWARAYLNREESVLDFPPVRGYRRGDRITLAAIFDTELFDEQSALQLTFDALNIGDDPTFSISDDVRREAVQYLSQSTRGFRVGDVIALGTVEDVRFYSVDSIGFTELNHIPDIVPPKK